LIAKSADYTLEDKEGIQPPFYAIDFYRPECLQLMLDEYGSELFTLSDNEGNNIVTRAIEKRSWRCFSLLYKSLGEGVLELTGRDDKLPEQIAEECAVLP